MLRHILPNSLAPVVVVLTILLGQFIALEATLSFLGVSSRGTVSWGVSIAEAKDWVSQSMLPLLFPAGFLTATVLLCVNAVSSCVLRSKIELGGRGTR